MLWSCWLLLVGFSWLLVWFTIICGDYGWFGGWFICCSCISVSGCLICGVMCLLVYTSFYGFWVKLVCLVDLCWFTTFVV